jgi:hypothetical protein
MIGILFVVYGCISVAESSKDKVNTSFTAFAAGGDGCSAETENSPGDATDSAGAPSYKEILETTNRIVAGKERLSEAQTMELEAFYESLRGKRIQSWCGWVSSVFPDEKFFSTIQKPVDQYPFRVSISMNDPKKGLGEGSVTIEPVYHEQVSHLNIWHNPLTPENIDELTYQKVVFTGTVVYVVAYNHLAISDATLQIVK